MLRFIFLLLLGGSLYADKICLTMIVKNEAPIIERCLKSVLGIVDCVSICDTGSSDNTIAIIEAFLKQHHLPGKVHHHEWTNFGANRTLSIQEAQKTLADLGFFLSESYLLILDADMVLSAFDFRKEELKEECYYIEQHTPSYNSFSLRLLRASLPWESIGAINEYWACKVPHHKGRLATLVIEDKDDSACKVGKYERDIALASSDLNNPRSIFHLAQTYKNLKNYDDAIKWYMARLEKGGDADELWYSKYMLGECYEAKKQWDQAVPLYLNAFQMNPKRAEPLLNLANYYRSHGQYHLAFLFAKQGTQIPYPDEPTQFISPAIYKYRFDEELSIASFYTPFKEIGFHAVNNLTLKKGVPEHTKAWADQNLLFYVKDIPRVSLQPILCELPLIREGFFSHYLPMNPSIEKTEEGYNVICRAVNYIQFGAREFHSLDLLDPIGTIRTRNFLLRYDKEWRLLSQHEITEKMERVHIPCYNSEGIEDCRLFSFENALWFTCTTCDTSPLGEREISLCQMSETGDVTKLVRLKGPNPRRCEKNWLPFVKEGRFHVIYSYDPFIVYQPDMETGECHTVCDYIPTSDFTKFRGSAAPIPWKDGFLVLVHEVVFKGDRIYLHRFLHLNSDFEVEKVSKPFTFLHQGVEYCCAMTLDHSNKNLILSIGIEDREAYLLGVDAKVVEDFLEGVP